MMKQVQPRPICYPVPKTVIYSGDNSLNADEAKRLLGWEEESPEHPLSQTLAGTFSLFKRHIFCHNNVTNRPISTSVVEALCQEILRKRWQLNGEPRIIGKTGLVLNGQHTLLALILAVERWREDPANWPEWPSEPTIETFINFGISEDDKTINTMDTCRPRSLAEVLYRNPYFIGETEKTRRQACRMLQFAIRLLWYRTGVSLQVLAPRQTHSEAIAFLERHPRLIQCVREIIAINSAKKVLEVYASLGCLAGLLYLMGSSTSDREKYLLNSNENVLKWDAWDIARQYFQELAKRSSAIEPVFREIARLFDQGELGTETRWAILVNGWKAYRAKNFVAPSDVVLQYDTKSDKRILAEYPVTGGIDIGSPRYHIAILEEQKMPSEKAILKIAQELRKTKMIPKKKNPERWSKGDVAWVYDQDGEHYLAKLLDDQSIDPETSQYVMVRSSTGDWEVAVEDLSLEYPRQRKKPVAVEPAKEVKGFRLRQLVWARLPKQEPWEGRITEIDLVRNSVLLTVQQGFPGAGMQHWVPLQYVSREQLG